MPDLYDLFNHNTAYDNTKAVFGRCKTHATSFYHNKFKPTICYAMSNQVAPWVYDLKMMEFNYIGDAQREKTKVPDSDIGSEDIKEKEPTNSTEDTTSKTTHSLSVINNPNSMFTSELKSSENASPDQNACDGHPKTLVCLYGVHAQSPILLNISLHENRYDSQKHGQIVGIIDRLLRNNQTSEVHTTVVDVVDYYSKVSLLNLQKEQLKKVSAIYPIRRIQPTTEEGLENYPEIDHLTHNIQKTFEDIRYYFDTKIDNTTSNPCKNDGIHPNIIKVKCEDNDIKSKYCQYPEYKHIVNVTNNSNDVRISADTESTTFKPHYIKIIRSLIKPSICSMLSEYICKIEGILDVATFNMKKNKLTLRLGDDQEGFIKSLNSSSLPTAIDTDEKIHGSRSIITTLDEILKYYMNTNTVTYPTTSRIIKHLLINGIEMYAKLDDNNIRTRDTEDDKYKLSLLLHAAFEKVFYKRFRKLVQYWILNSLKKYQIHEYQDTDQKDKKYIANISTNLLKLKSELKTTYLEIKTNLNKKFRISANIRSHFENYTNIIKSLSKILKGCRRVKTSQYQLHSQFIVFSKESTVFINEIKTFDANSKNIGHDSNIIIDQLIGKISSVVGEFKSAFDHRICVGLKSEEDIYAKLYERFDVDFSEKSFSDLFELFARPETKPLDKDETVKYYVSNFNTPKGGAIESVKNEVESSVSAPVVEPEKQIIPTTQIDPDQNNTEIIEDQDNTKTDYKGKFSSGGYSASDYDKKEAYDDSSSWLDQDLF